MEAKITEKDNALFAIFGHNAPKEFSASGYRYHGSGKPGDVIDARIILHGGEIVATDMKRNVKIGSLVKLTLSDNTLASDVFKVTKVNPEKVSWLTVKHDTQKKGFELQDGEFEFI